MRRADVRGPGLAATILDYLKRRGEPASSHLIAGQFLRMPVGSEQLATRLLRPLLEPAGARYVESVGWAPAAFADSSAAMPRFIGAAIAAHAASPAAPVLADAEGSQPEHLEQATVVMLDPAREAHMLRAWLLQRRMAAPASILSLRTAVRGGARVRRGAELGDFCAALGVRWLDSEDARGAARAMAACAEESASRRSMVLAVDPAPALPAGITAEQLASLPEAPGVYRFFDRNDALIYVGKAANLRRRVASYFTGSTSRQPRRFYASIHRLEHEVVGSELEALLEEARLIARRRPEGNIQMNVRERGRSYGAARSWALLLPRAGGHGVTAIIMHDGRCLGHFSIGPRGGGLASARQLLGRAVCGPKSRARAQAPSDRDTEILQSWLARNGEAVSRVELDAFRKVADASLALRAAANHLIREPGPAVFR